VTTMVEPEVPPRRPRGVRLVLVAVAAIAATALIIVGASALGRDDPTLPNAGPPGDSLNAPYIADASFVLQNYGTLTTEAVQFWRDTTPDQVVSLGLPFLRYNRYYTRFFLKEGRDRGDPDGSERADWSLVGREPGRDLGQCCFPAAHPMSNHTRSLICRPRREAAAATSRALRGPAATGRSTGL